MTNRQDANSIRARSIRAHLRVFLNEVTTKGDVSFGHICRFISDEQAEDWNAAMVRIEKVRRQQQDARYLASEAGLSDLFEVIKEGQNLKRLFDELQARESRLEVAKSTDASRIRVARKKVRLERAKLDEFIIEKLPAKIAQFGDDHWIFARQDDRREWLIHWKTDNEVAPIPVEILQAEKIQLLERWIGEWDKWIDDYESLPNPSIK